MLLFGLYKVYDRTRMEVSCYFINGRDGLPCLLSPSNTGSELPLRSKRIILDFWRKGYLLFQNRDPDDENKYKCVENLHKTAINEIDALLEIYIYNQNQDNENESISSLEFEPAKFPDRATPVVVVDEELQRFKSLDEETRWCLEDHLGLLPLHKKAHPTKNIELMQRFLESCNRKSQILKWTKQHYMHSPVYKCSDQGLLKTKSHHHQILSFEK